MERATNSSLILYTTEDGLTKIEATFDRDTVWLSIDQMADLFQRNKSTISRHIGNIYKEGELDKTATVAKFATVQMEGERLVSISIIPIIPAPVFLSCIRIPRSTGRKISAKCP